MFQTILSRLDGPLTKRREVPHNNTDKNLPIKRNIILILNIE